MPANITIIFHPTIENQYFFQKITFGTIFITPQVTKSIAMKHIIIVSTDRFRSDVVTYSLHHPELELSITQSPDQLYTQCAKRGAEIVIFLEMEPYFTSFNIVTELRNSGQHTPIVYVISQLLSEQVVLALLESGVNQYLTFPLDTVRLRNKVFREVKIMEGSQW